MSAAAGSAAARADGRLPPSDPYPGLRPFMRSESMLLFGRERQVREVLTKLQRSQFVAVIGGSGSGKSSLVLAGVLPELRSFAIPGAGDFWVPMVCTPGTNASQVDRAARASTPITRLARKFAALLRSRGTPEQDETRLREIEARLREELGFTNLVRVYSDELEVPPGPDAKEARLLFVIDQFEEVFHPTTRDLDDTRLLVERVIEHFFSPHPRCYIALTMRSEHLNDCAGYLELPDAINEASYLVRRLDERELEEAITRPPQRLLRLMQFAEEDTRRLPEKVEFDEAVIARLLRDTQAIREDPDHLPLLQHVLARCWEAAKNRVAGRLDFPDTVVAADLEAAVAGPVRLTGQGSTDAADATGAARPATGAANVLTASLENWAEAAYLRQSEQDRVVLDLLLRQLALKDPLTGMYSQQRVNVDEWGAQLKPPRTAHDLRALIVKSFAGDVEYLFWDDDDPRRVTLKVWHESLIRGWARLRRVTDEEAERFDAFVELLKKCHRWQRGGRREELLLERGDLEAVDQSALETQVLAESERRAAWFNRLGTARAFEGLNQTAGDVDMYVRLSRAGVQERLGRDKRRRLTVQWTVVGSLVLVPPLLYFTVVRGPVIDRTRLLISGSKLAIAQHVAPEEQEVGSEQKTLRALLDAVDRIERGRQGDSKVQRLNRAVLDRFAAWPLIGRTAAYVDEVAAVTEPTVNARLRTVLESGVWSAAWDDQSARASSLARLPPIPLKCRIRQWNGEIVTVPGQLFRWQSRSDPKFNRYLFVPEVAQPSKEDLTLHAVKFMGAEKDGTPSDCRSTQELGLPGLGDLVGAEVAFDADLRFMVVVFNSPNTQPAAKVAALFEIDWRLMNGAGDRRLQAMPRVTLTGKDDVQAVLAHMRVPLDGGGRGPLFETLRTKAGRAFRIGDKGWRIVDQFAQPLVDGRPEQWIELNAAGSSSDCGSLGKILSERASISGLDISMWEAGNESKRCFAIGRFQEAGAFLDPIEVVVFAKPTPEVLNGKEEPAKIADLPRFTRVPLGPANTIKWRLGTGDYEGWISASFKTVFGGSYTATAPWSTCALWRLGKDILKEPLPKDICQTGAGPVIPAQGGPAAQPG